jgi:hypothetical protein
MSSVSIVDELELPVALAAICKGHPTNFGPLCQQDRKKSKEITETS